MFPHMYKVRPRSSVDRSNSITDEARPEWQNDTWRRNSNRWPPSSPGGETPLPGGDTPPLKAASALKQSPSTSGMPSCPPPIPAPPSDPQDDLNRGAPTGSPIPWRLQQRSRSGSPALQQLAAHPSTPRTRRRPQQQEESGPGLRVPDGGGGTRSRMSKWRGKLEKWVRKGNKSQSERQDSVSPTAQSASPFEVWGTPEEQWDSASGMRGTPSPSSGSPRVRRRRDPASSSSGDVYHTQQEASQATDAEASEGSVDASSNGPVAEKSDARDVAQKGLSNEVEDIPEIQTEFVPDDEPEDVTIGLRLQMPICNGRKTDENLDVTRNGNSDDLDERSSSPAEDDERAAASPEIGDEWKHLLGDALGNHTIGDDDDDDLESGRNAFYQPELSQDLFKGGNVSYIPGSKQEFLLNQQQEDQKYIMAALDQERDEILEPYMKSKEVSEATPLPESDATKTDHLDVSENEEDSRAWSPGSPIFKRDLERHRQDAAADDQAWWESDRPASGLGTVPQPPPMPGVVPPCPFPTKVDPSSTMPKIRKSQLENIKKAVRTRPDWHTLMKNLEDGVKLRHVTERNDRSTPILPSTRGKNGKFVYDSEKPTVVNELLHEIQRGVRLRRTRTDDRSKPDFSKLGLKKIRRQLTVEEKKKVKPEDPEALPSSSDDEEDIDNMRDDLDATKTQLADEIKKTKKLEREKKVMKIDMESLHAEVKKLKRQLRDAGIHDKPMLNGEDGIMPKLEKSMSKLRMSEKEDLDFNELDTIESEIKELNGQIDVQRKRAEGMETKVFELEQKLKVAEVSADEWEGRSIFFEKKYKALQRDHNIELPDIGIVGTQTDPVEFYQPDSADHPLPIDGFGSSARKSGSRRSFASQINRMESFQEAMDEDTSSSSSEESEEEEGEEEEEEEEQQDGDEDDATLAGGDDDDEDDEEKQAKRAAAERKRIERDLQFWGTKLDNMKAKEANVAKERASLRERIKKFYKDMYQERVDYLKAKSELDELVGQLKDPESGNEEEEEEEEEEEDDPREEEPGWWFDQPNLKPKKLKKKKKKTLNADGEVVEEEEEEDLEDLTQLEEPCWSDSEGDESDPDDENDPPQVKLNFMQSRLKKHEQKMNRIKKENYELKTEADKCKEKYSEERLRRRRLDEELNMLVADMQ